MATEQIVRSLLQQAHGAGSRSSALAPLAWLVGILVAGAVASARFDASGWVLSTLVGLSGLSVLIYLAAFLFLMFRDRDALRSERYSLQKLAIERGLLGDSTQGVLDGEVFVQNSSRLTSGSADDSEVAS